MLLHWIVTYFAPNTAFHLLPWFIHVTGERQLLHTFPTSALVTVQQNGRVEDQRRCRKFDEFSKPPNRETFRPAHEDQRSENSF